MGETLAVEAALPQQLARRDSERPRCYPSSDMTKILGGGLGTALGNVIGFCFGARSSAPG